MPSSNSSSTFCSVRVRIRFLVILAQIIVQYSWNCHFTAVRHQKNTAEVGVLGNARDNLAGRYQILTGLAAAELLVESDDTVKVLCSSVFFFGHLRQLFQRTVGTEYGGDDGKMIPDTGTGIAAVITHECIIGRAGEDGYRIEIIRVFFGFTQTGHFIMFMNPFPFPDRPGGVTNDIIVFPDRFTLLEIFQCDFMCIWNVVEKNDGLTIYNDGFPSFQVCRCQSYGILRI